MIKLASSLFAVLCWTKTAAGGNSMYDDRKKLRTLLRALIAEREDSALLYIPNGETGMRRMICALLEMRTPRESDPLAAMIEDFVKEK